MHWLFYWTYSGQSARYQGPVKLHELNTIVTGNETVLFHYQVLLADGRVIRIEGPEVLMDFNHPLIGKNVRYEIKIVAVEASSKEA